MLLTMYRTSQGKRHLQDKPRDNIGQETIKESSQEPRDDKS